MPQGPRLEGFHCIYMYMICTFTCTYDDIVLFFPKKIFFL